MGHIPSKTSMLEHVILAIPMPRFGITSLLEALWPHGKKMAQKNFISHRKEWEAWFKKEVILPKLEQACLLVLAEAQRLTAKEGPLKAIDTGTLLRSLTYEVLENDLIGRVGTNLEYALYVLLGTLKMAPRPILQTALVNMRPQIQRLFAMAA